MAGQCPVERWLSGRKRRFAKPVTGVNLVHGFESRPLRLLGHIDFDTLQTKLVIRPAAARQEFLVV